MIARIWRGAVRAQDASAYAEYVQRTGTAMQPTMRSAPDNRAPTPPICAVSLGEWRQ